MGDELIDRDAAPVLVSGVVTLLRHRRVRQKVLAGEDIGEPLVALLPDVEIKARDLDGAILVGVMGWSTGPKAHSVSRWSLFWDGAWYEAVSHEPVGRVEDDESLGRGGGLVGQRQRGGASAARSRRPRLAERGVARVSRPLLIS